MSAVRRIDVTASALAEHLVNSNHGDFEETAALVKEPSTPIRKTKEAYLIRKLKAGLNRKEEKGAFDPFLYGINSWNTVDSLVDI